MIWLISSKVSFDKRIVIVSLVLLVTLGAGILNISCTCGVEPAEPPPIPEEPEEGVYLIPTFIETKPGREISVEIKMKPSGGELMAAR